MSVPTVRVLRPTFGQPLLRAAGDGIAKWSKVNALSQWQKGTGWQASLTGGTQDSASWAAAFVPIEGQLKVEDFNSALWSYYLTSTQTFGFNIVIWAHDHDNLNKRAEITQLGNTSALGKTAKWNAHTLDKTTTQFIWYGEDWSGTTVTALTGSGLDSGTQYTWAQFQADVLFKKYLIYRISIENGYEASGTFAEAWLTELILNGTVIPIMPSELEEEAANRGQWMAATIATDDYASSEIDLGGNFQYMEINIPTLISTTLKVTVTETPGGTHLDLGNGITSPAGTHNYNDVWKIGGWRYIKIVSSAQQTTPDKEIRVRGVNF